MMRTLLIMLVLSASMLAQQTMKLPSPCESTRQVLSPTGNRLVVQCKDGSVHLLDLPSGRELRNESPPSRVSTHEFSRDGRWLGLGLANGTVEIWPTSENASVIRWKAGDRAVELLKFAPDKQILLVGNVSEPDEVWDFSKTPTRLATLSSDFGSFTSAAFSPDGKMLATTGGDTVVRFFETAHWKQLRENRDLALEPFAIQFTNDGKQVVIGGADGQLTLLDPATAKTLRKLPEERDPVDQLQFVNENRVVAVYIDVDGHKPPHLKLWNLDTGTSTPIQMDPTVTGGGIANGKVWMVKASSSAIELSSGN